MNLNQIITYLLYIIKLVESYLLKYINTSGGHTYENWDDFMNAHTTTAVETTAPETTA